MEKLNESEQIQGHRSTARLWDCCHLPQGAIQAIQHNLENLIHIYLFQCSIYNMFSNS
jgi:hypothetical protein